MRSGIVDSEKGILYFEFEKSTYEGIVERLGSLSDQAPKVMKNALNATARDAKKELAKLAQKTYASKAVNFKRAIKQKNATTSNMEATLNVSGRPMGLIDYKYRPSTSEAVMAKVLKAGPLKSLQKGTLKSFVVKFRSGHMAIVRRDPPNQYSGRYLTERRLKHQDTTKLNVYYSLSIPQMIGSRQRVYGVLKPKIAETLQKHVNKQIEKVMSK